MSVKIRLARFGAKKKPFYRVVVADSRYPRDGRFIEAVGTYDPRDKSAGLNLNLEKIQNWISNGAECSETVQKLIRNAKPVLDSAS
jgi:small subunit ribosomal protein S16